ncbi:MAG: hypothetical protein QOI71_325 [Gaiellales bacterium]|nr:hypothetical protein [Gaiellales bacterium]
MAPSHTRGGDDTAIPYVTGTFMTRRQGSERSDGPGCCAAAARLADQ